MTTFLFAYRMPEDYVPGSAEAPAKWRAYFESLGASLRDRGNPAFESRALGNCGPGTKLGGYSLVTADDLETAITVAKQCPAVRDGSGGVEVGVITELDPAAQT